MELVDVGSLSPLLIVELQRGGYTIFHSALSFTESLLLGVQGLLRSKSARYERSHLVDRAIEGREMGNSFLLIRMKQESQRMKLLLMHLGYLPA